MPLPTLKPTIVLSDFTRSFSAEKKEMRINKQWAVVYTNAKAGNGPSEKRAGSMACADEAFF